MHELKQLRVQITPLELVELDLMMHNTIPVVRRPPNIRPLFLVYAYPEGLKAKQGLLQRNSPVAPTAVNVHINEPSGEFPLATASAKARATA